MLQFCRVQAGKLLFLPFLASVLPFIYLPDAVAEEPTLPKASYVSSQTVKSWLEEGRAVLLVDVREPVEFEAGHIEGALNIPYAEVENQSGTLKQKLQELKEQRAFDKEGAIIF